MSLFHHTDGAYRVGGDGASNRLWWQSASGGIVHIHTLGVLLPTHGSLASPLKWSWEVYGPFLRASVV